MKISLEKRTKEDISIIKNFCQEIYDYSFASKYFHDKKKNAIYIEIQKATKIVNFFNGIWMEWFVYMMLLDLFKKRNISYSLIKGLKITHNNRDKNELDIFFIVHDTPVYIECKSGEFRREIDKYLKLKKRLRLNKEHFIMCVIGLDTMQTDGLSSTYDMTFTNQNNLLPYIDSILVEAEANENKIAQIKESFVKNSNPPTPIDKPTPKRVNSSIDSEKKQEATQEESSFLKSIMSPFKK